MPNQTVDYAIAGGGLSGLLLAWYLAHEPRLRNKRIVVVERQAHVYERTISFWLPPGQLRALPASNLIQNTWSKVRMCTHDYERDEELGSYQFGVFDYREYIERLRDELSRLPNIDILFEEVVSLGRQRLVTDNHTIHAEYVFDSTSLLRKAHGPYMPALTMPINLAHSDTMTFFDTRITGLGYSAFAYVLPISPKQSLLQIAAIVPEPQSLDRYQIEKAAIDYVHKYLSDETSTKQQSRLLAQGKRLSSFGVIPLRISYPNAGDVPIPIGLNAELVKPTTGYGFARFVQHAIDITDSLANGNEYVMRRRLKSNIFRQSDQVLLRQIRNDPTVLEDFFSSIIRYASPEQLLSWLDEAPGPRAITRLSLAFCSNTLKRRR